jgi:trehalose utilization protein
MKGSSTRRDFLRNAGAAMSAASAAGRAPGRDAPPTSDAPIEVVVWDERLPAQKQAYANYLGNQIAGHLKEQPGISVRSVCLDDADHGLGPDVLGRCRVLIRWGHVRQAEIAPEVGRAIVVRIKEGTLSLIALHSAHWSTPFVEAMNERARIDAERTIRSQAGADKVEIVEAAPPRRYTLPTVDTRLTPYVSWRKFPERTCKATIHLPYCCFPAYRGDGKPSRLRVLRPDHPIAAGVPAEFELPHTEMYDEPFHVPEPDVVVFEERWEPGEWFRSGSIWTLGRGKVFYFRPGHETFAVFKEPVPLQILTNAVRWLASAPA